MFGSDHVDCESLRRFGIVNAPFDRYGNHARNVVLVPRRRQFSARVAVAPREKLVGVLAENFHVVVPR